MKPVHYHLGAFPPNLDWSKLIALIGPANAAVARYAGLLEGMPSPTVLISPLMTQEAVISSRIEGTQATMGEVLELEAQGRLFDEDTEKKKDIGEVLNYRAALNEAVRLLGSLPLSQRLICDTHRVLMRGVRGRNKSPGEYRRIPNWIGPGGCTIENARFVPVLPNRLPDAMSAWETFLHSEQPDIFVQLALIHAEFEAIHPFLDGNGRLGRLLIPLFLYNQRILPMPAFYLSAYFDRYRDEYYARLLSISRDGDWTGWVSFFLTAIIDQASENQTKILTAFKLYNDLKAKITESAHSQFGIKALDWMFQRPIFNASDFRKNSGIPDQTAARILRVCRNMGMIEVLHEASGRRPAIMWFPDLMAIAEGSDGV